ncbi:cytochrome P450 [Boletus edulis BED1]|uniref:Cytochrome P450 n=1 Tax=Boletus edulis BED1 TaxID=1328754 RepID=A0AAD4BRU9_BOLED|nr:cytochrome P450 [Boletus edulis BED1]
MPIPPAVHSLINMSSIVLKSTYDYDPPSQDDELIKIVVKVHEIALSVVRPDVAIGICCHFPDNPEAPGLVSGDVETTFEYSLQRIEGLGSHTFFHVSTQHSLKRNCSIAPSMEAKGTFDRYSLAFLLVMFASPASEKENAQVEIDAVVGRDRLPTMDDRPWLPFIDAIFRETLRYSPAVPSSVPHVAVDDDVYRGFRIQRQTYGRHFADTSVWAVIANVLAVFKILRPLDENGVEIPVEPKFTTRLVVHRRRVDFDPVHRRPLPIQCRIVPRMPGMDGEKLEELIAAS